MGRGHAAIKWDPPARYSGGEYQVGHCRACGAKVTLILPSAGGAAKPEVSLPSARCAARAGMSGASSARAGGACGCRRGR